MLWTFSIAAFIALMIAVLPNWPYSQRWGYRPVIILMIVTTAGVLSQPLFLAQ